MLRQQLSKLIATRAGAMAIWPGLRALSACVRATLTQCLCALGPGLCLREIWYSVSGGEVMKSHRICLCGDDWGGVGWEHGFWSMVASSIGFCCRYFQIELSWV